MRPKLKPLREQVVVVTGASSGIGLAVARAAAARGARLVLAARNDEALDEICREIVEAGGEAVAVVADVGVEEDVRRISETANERFGGFDTWVNNAGVSIFGSCEEVSMADHRRMFDTNYWGTVYGSLAAVNGLRSRGGALINMGDTLGDRAVPLQGAYSASKHALKAYTDALRMELARDSVPVSVTLIKPSSIATPSKDHARNYLPLAPRNAPPLYAPETVADAVLYAAEQPVRELTIGASGRLLGLIGNLAPWMTDRFMQAALFDAQVSHMAPRAHGRDSLYGPGEDGCERSPYPDRVMERSLYTETVKAARRNPGVTAALTLGAGAVIARALVRRGPRI